MSVLTRVAFLVAVLAAMPASAASTDPLSLPACKQALATLQQLESAAVSSQRDSSHSEDQRRAAVQAVQAQQKRSALACQLDTDPPAAPLAARIREPVRVSPSVLPSAPRPRPQVPATSPTPGPGPQPVTLGACDEQGCWTSDGRRLSRAGAMLIGPRGLCSQHGVVLRCP